MSSPKQLDLESSLLPPRGVRLRSTESERHEKHGYTGMALLLMSALVFSLVGALAQKATGWWSSTQLMFCRSVIQGGVAWFICRRVGGDLLGPWGDKRLMGWVMLRGVTGALANWILYFSLSQLPVGDCNCLFFTQPLFTVVLAPCLLGEIPHKLQLIAIVFGIAGVVMIARPEAVFGSREEARPTAVDPSIPRHLAVIVCLFGAFMATFVFLCVRRIGQRVHWSSLVFSFGFFGSLLSGGLLLLNGEANRLPPAEEGALPYLAAVTVGVGAVVAQSMFNRGMQMESAITASMLRQSDVVFAYIWQVCLLGMPLEALSVVGASMVMGGLFVNAVLKQRLAARKKEEKN